MKYATAKSIRYIIEKACAIQQIPSPTFHEADRANYIFEEFSRIGLQEVSKDKAGNVFAGWSGGGDACLVISAHLDNVHNTPAPMPLERTSERITGPGIADNALGLACLLGLGRHLADTRADFSGQIWLVADVGEEGLGNLAGMSAVVERFEKNACAFLVLEGTSLGQVCHRGLGVVRLRIIAETAGGHAWGNYGTPSAIHELAEVITGVTRLTLPRKPRTTLNVGILQGGTAINTIAAKASCDLDLRSEDQATLTRLTNRVKRLVKSRIRPGVAMKIETVGTRPAGAIRPSHPLVKLALDTLADLNVPANLEIGSSDANCPLSLGFPAVCLGITRGGNPHTVNEYIDLAPIQTGMEQVLQIVHRAWDVLESPERSE